METYKVLYVDEQENARQEFDELADEELKIESIHPTVSENELINYLMEEKFDALVIDYGLMKDAKIKYNGDDVIKKVNEIKEDFPALILTQDVTQDDGVDEKIEPTKILTKKELADDGEKVKRKIKKTIRFYRNESDSLSKEMNDLVKKRREQNGNLSNEEMERLNYIDETIERRLNGKRQFPNLLKESEQLQSLKSVLKKAEDFFDQNTNT